MEVVYEKLLMIFSCLYVGRWFITVGWDDIPAGGQDLNGQWGITAVKALLYIELFEGYSFFFIIIENSEGFLVLDRYWGIDGHISMMSVLFLRSEASVFFCPLTEISAAAHQIRSSVQLWPERGTIYICIYRFITQFYCWSHPQLLCVSSSLSLSRVNFRVSRSLIYSEKVFPSSISSLVIFSFSLLDRHVDLWSCRLENFPGWMNAMECL